MSESNVSVPLYKHKGVVAAVLSTVAFLGIFYFCMANEPAHMPMNQNGGHHHGHHHGGSSNMTAEQMGMTAEEHANMTAEQMGMTAEEHAKMMQNQASSENHAQHQH